MTECIMCHSQIGAGVQHCVEDGEHFHTECRAEFGRRHAASECVMCGKRCEYPDYHCMECMATNNLRYTGYSPPGGG